MTPASVFASIPKAFQHNHCEAFLTERTGYTPLSFRETAEGAPIYERLMDIVGRHSSSFMDIIQLPENANWTVSDALKFIAMDRYSLRTGLAELIHDFSSRDDHKKMVSYVLRLFDLTMKDDEFEDQLARLTAKYGGRKASTIFTPHSEVASFVYKNWKYNRSYVAELLTAFEVKGAFALSAKIYELIPKNSLEDFVAVFLAEGKLNYLDMEIDVVAFNPETGHQVWVEVKNVMQRITSEYQEQIPKYREKMSKLQDFKRIVSSHPKLRHVFSDQIDFVWVVRGAGVDENLRREQAARGLFMFDRSVDGINQLIDRRARQAPTDVLFDGQSSQNSKKRRSRRAS